MLEWNDQFSEVLFCGAPLSMQPFAKPAYKQLTIGSTLFKLLEATGGCRKCYLTEALFCQVRIERLLYKRFNEQEHTAKSSESDKNQSE